ncbi:Energy-coupling factor transporter ATP-binding protein EcfA1 [Coriobacteriaceae bacterium CHKCI002]|nr:Energy-coupling factor transporter ATP-binding protein EcfA1 [Coriobacteriaceae bacterium CHKCI002]
MVFQDVNYQLFADSVEAEVSFGLGKRERPSAKRVGEILEGLGLAGLEERHPATLSGGQKQRLAVAACVASGKRLLVFDEPTSGLDLGGMRAVADLVRRLADEGRAVLVVTHDLEFVARACDRALLVEKGRVAREAVVEGDLAGVRALLAEAR